MSKAFYVVIPYNGASLDDKPGGFIEFFRKFLQRFKGKQTDSDFVRQKKQFASLKKGLDHRVNIVSASLENCGVKVNRLNTQQLIELYYNSYNPELSRLQKISNLSDSDLTTE
jgi:hypothetical protein